MSPRRTVVVVAVAALLVASGCDGGDSEEASEETASEEAGAEGSRPGADDVAGAEDAVPPEELAGLYAVAVPEGMRVVAAGEDAGAGTATFELAYDGDPDVDGYRQAMVDAGWTVDSEGPLESYGWCLRYGEIAREVLARLGIAAGPLVAYVVLVLGGVQWQIGGPDRDCVVGEGLNAPD